MGKIILKMKFVLALIGAATAVQLGKDKPTRAHEYNEFGQAIPHEETFKHNNKEILENFADMYVQHGPELLGLDGWQWNQAPIPAPETNYCTNANKATADDQACSDPGNSAWNTHTSAATAKPTKALDLPYPDHAGVTYGVKGEVYTVA